MARSAQRKIRGASSDVMLRSRTYATVTLKHLAANLSQSHDISKREGEAILGDLVSLITKHLKKGHRIQVGSLGTLVQKRAGNVRVIEAGAPNVPTVELTAESAYAPVESAYEPSARARALLRGKEIFESDLKKNGGSYSLQDVETLLEISRQAIDKKVRDKGLLAVPGPQGRRRYPVIQFTDDGTLLPGLQDVLESLPSSNGRFCLNFLVNPDARLDGRRPIDLLREGRIDPVVTAAKAVGVQGA